jgi:hypothetical protein
VVNFLTDNYDTPAGPSVDVYPPLVVYDISGSTPVVIGVAAIAPATVYAAWAVAINGTIAYVTTFLWNPNAGLYPPLVAYDISADIPVVVGAAAIDPVNGYDGFSVAANDTGTYVMNSLTYGDESLHPALVAYVRPRLSSTVVPSSGGAVSRCQVSHVLPSRLLARDWSAFQRQIEALRPADVEEVRGSRFDFC